VHELHLIKSLSEKRCDFQISVILGKSIHKGTLSGGSQKLSSGDNLLSTADLLLTSGWRDLVKKAIAELRIFMKKQPL
jgi:hypothetical protein